MKLQTNENAETPIEVMFVVMFAIIVMTFLTFVSGAFMDKFMATISEVDISLSSWGSNMMDLIPNKYSPWIYLVPPFFVMVFMIWGIKTVVKRHRYTTQDTQYIGDDGF